MIGWVLTRRRSASRRRGGGQAGQASIVMIGALVVVVGSALVLSSVGTAFLARGSAQQVVDLAAIAAGRQMRADFPRLFVPDLLPDGRPNPRHLERDEYAGRARGAALATARRNGGGVRAGDVTFDGGFAPTEVTVTRLASHVVELPRAVAPSRRERTIPIHTRATVRLAVAISAGAGTAMPGVASGGGYGGPLAYRQGIAMRPDVAAAFDRMAAAARTAGHMLIVNSGFRSDAEQGRLFDAHPDPRWVAKPGTSLHRYATELDVGPPGAYAWLAANARGFGFIKRYAWEPWHFGFGANPRDVPAEYEVGSREPPDGVGAGGGRMQPFVPDRYRDAIARAAQRWNVPAAALAAQLYVESGFNPNARSPAGAEGIAQFMPGTAHAYGLRDPGDPDASIDAQAHLMHDLLVRFKQLPLALAAYNAGPGAVASFGGIPPYPETQAYVAKIIALIGGATGLPLVGSPGDAGAIELRPRLVR